MQWMGIFAIICNHSDLRRLFIVLFRVIVCMSEVNLRHEGKQLFYKLILSKPEDRILVKIIVNNFMTLACLIYTTHYN